jgi:hypothetical protein
MTEQATEAVVTASKEGRIGTITLSRKGNNSIAADLGASFAADVAYCLARRAAASFRPQPSTPNAKPPPIRAPTLSPMGSADATTAASSANPAVAEATPIASIVRFFDSVFIVPSPGSRADWMR